MISESRFCLLVHDEYRSVRRLRGLLTNIEFAVKLLTKLGSGAIKYTRLPVVFLDLNLNVENDVYKITAA